MNDKFLQTQLLPLIDGMCKTRPSMSIKDIKDNFPQHWTKEEREEANVYLAFMGTLMSQ